MEMKSPPPCPATVTVRRNPPRKARATPLSAVPLRQPLSSPSLSRDIFATKITPNPIDADCVKTDSATTSLPENLKVFLRIRPPIIQKNCRTTAEQKNAWPKNPKLKSNPRPKTKKSSEMCVLVNEDLRSVTVSTPQPFQEMKRIKSEVYEGFSHVFSTESSQTDVYEEMVKPLVEDFLKGKSGMLAALGPSGSGKTHTVFGSSREPGMVPLALRRIFNEDESSAAQSSSWVVYLSMFEISSERGKGEKMIDLLHDGGDVSMQHLVIKGLREAVFDDAQQAESLIARGMLKRATANTNSNSQSSRSQCIINIRCGSKQVSEEVDVSASSTVLTIVDLAGAEREKKTGNQGARLLESNFINNTSMVFGQCLRSLLEHQKNRNKTLQKHYKNSLLTRYLRDYLEGRKRMMLILTVKPGVEDYLDTSFLLRQASPFAKIKFKTVEEPVNLTNKRPNQGLPQAGQLKKMKFGNNEISLIDEGKIDRCSTQNLHEELSGKEIEVCLDQNIQGMYDENINKIHALSNGFSGLGIQEKMSLKGNDSKLKVKKDREYQIMLGLSKALWNVLKQYKEKLKGVETEKCHLKDSLANEKTRNLGLTNELTKEKRRILDLENEVKELKSRCTCCAKPSSDVLQVLTVTHGFSFDLSTAVTPEVKSDIVSPSLRGLENTENEEVAQICYANGQARDSVVVFTSCSDGDGEQHHQQLEGILESSDDTENTKGSKPTSEVDTCFKIGVLSTSMNSSQELVCCEDMCVVDIPATSETATQDMCVVDIPATCEAATQSTSMALHIVGDVKNLESDSECALDRSCLVASIECKSNTKTQDHENLGDAEKVLAQFQIDNGTLLAEKQNISMAANSHADLKPSEFQWNGGTCNHANFADNDTSLVEESECALDRPRPLDSLEYENNRNAQDYDNLRGAEQELTQFQNDNVPLKVEEQNIPMAASSHADLQSSESQLNGYACNHANIDGASLVGEQNVPTATNSLANNKSSESPCNGDKCDRDKEEVTLEPLGTLLPREGLDAQKNNPKLVPKAAPCSNQLPQKPRRRLQPVSSILLKDLSLLDIKDENDKPKGAKAGKRGTADEKSRTQGSLSLLNLLTSKLDR